LESKETIERTTVQPDPAPTTGRQTNITNTSSSSASGNNDTDISFGKTQD